MTKLSEHPRNDVFNSYLVQGACFSSNYEFPIIRRTDFVPKEAIPFDKAFRTINHEQWVHFYIHDVQFERIWRIPDRYLPLLKRFQGVITPDFSLYTDMPLAMQIWNTYRNRAIGFWLHQNGVNIVSNVRWGDSRTYKFAFEGLERGGTVAVSTCGCIGNIRDRIIFRNGLKTLVDSIAPKTIICYSQMPEDIFGFASQKGIRLISIEHYAKTVRKVPS
jgi:hypothetical protein